MSLASTQAPAAGAPKGFRRGTHRTVSPEITLARLRPLLARMGITRVGVLTGLDIVGVPVATAIRPNGRALAVALGKGVSTTAARVSAIMEAAESFHAESVTGPLHWAAAHELPNAVDPSRLPLSATADTDEDLKAVRCLWISGRDLLDGTDRSVPFQLVHADYTVTQAEPHRFQATTSGLAAGNEPVEAQLHALYEVIERDAIACWRARGGPGRAGRPVDPAGADDEIADLVERIRAAAIDLAVWEVSGDIGIPVFVALLVPKSGERSGVEPEIGSGCHLDPTIALSRALTEAAQTRLARIAGARDDFDPESYRAEARRRRLLEARGWQANASLRPARWEALAEVFSWTPADDLGTDLEMVLAALDRAGFDEAVWIDLSRPELGLPVGRIVVPGLEGPWLPGYYRPGARARRLGAWA